MLKSFFSSLPRYFFLLFVVFFAVSFFTLYESFREYRAEATLLVLSKSPAVSAETVARNIVELSKTIAFYDRLLADHSNISDPWSDQSALDRRDAWDGVLMSSVIPETSLIHFSISSGSEVQSTALLNASLETLYGFSGRLYDHEREADIRLVDGVVVRPVVQYAWILVLASAFFAVVFAFLISTLFRVPFRAMSLAAFPLLRTGVFLNVKKMSKPLRPVGSFPDLSGEENVSPEVMPDPEVLLKTSEAEEKEEEMKQETQPEVILAQEMIPATTINTLEKENGEPHDISEKPRPVSIEKSVKNAVSVVGRPGNLESIPASDFSWEKYLFHNNDEMKATSEPMETKQEESSIEARVPEKREPTPEELKARLNQLLRGEL